MYNMCYILLLYCYIYTDCITRECVMVLITEDKIAVTSVSHCVFVCVCVGIVILFIPSTKHKRILVAYGQPPPFAFN